MKTTKCGDCNQFRHAWGRVGASEGYCLKLGIVVEAKAIPCGIDEDKKAETETKAELANPFPL